MINFSKNNLDKSSSPYLHQHKDNPVHWQEWSKEVLDYAKKNNRLILVSVGYATCHWCHVMAKESFDNKEAADYLNENFVSIKVDREQRPDIDQYMMSFLIASQGNGGWPLNVILSPDLKPLYAASYIPIEPRYGMPGFIDLITYVKKSYESQKSSLSEYRLPDPMKHDVEEDKLIEIIISSYDRFYGGFGSSPKFPPHNTLLFLLSHFEKTKDSRVGPILEKTLDLMSTRGLHDHLQGGFYRYCVDRPWTIPHFEKMLYDQAMLLWVYSSAYKIFDKPEYKIIVEKLISCLEETFEGDGLFYSAHDADTDHKEGETYLWTLEELREVLTVEELEKFSKLYEITQNGNFEGKNHLLRQTNVFLPNIERKLLEIRKIRDQPFTDKKIVTSWNALLGIGLIMAYRATGDGGYKTKSINLFERLMGKHHKDGKLIHSSLGNALQKEEFLEDYASVMLLATYLYEETGKHLDIVKELYEKINKFKKDRWYQSMNEDFREVPAQMFDHPTPSPISLAELAILRTKILLGEGYEQEKYTRPMESDFFNLMVFIRNGNFHIIHTPEEIDWRELPLNSMQVKSNRIQDCFGQMCREFGSVNELVKSLKG